MSEPHFIADEATAGRAESVVETVASALESLNPSGSAQIVQGRNKIFFLAYGWWAFIVRSSEAVVVLRRANLGHEASPIVRGILQHSLVLQWLIDTGDDAVDAVAEYGDNNVRKLLNTMKEARWPSIEGLDMATSPATASPNPLVPKIEDFSQLCIAYNARQLYVPFRLLSAYVHPTMVGARAYINEAAVEFSSVALADDTPLVIQTAMCLLQTTKVMNLLFVGDPLRTTIAQAEDILRIEVGLWSP